MKEEELRKICNCTLCGKPVGHTRLPLFWRVRIQRYGLKIDAIKRNAGLTMMLGGHVALAQIMGPNEDMAKKISEIEITVCETCALEKPLPVAVLAEEEDEEEAGGD